MRTNDIDVLIFVGDHVRDRMDDDRPRQISRIDDHGDDTASVYMTDGGVMGLDEIQFADITDDANWLGAQ